MRPACADLPRLREPVHGGFLAGLRSADHQDRNGVPVPLKSIRRSFPWLRHVLVDSPYAGPKLRGALDTIGTWTLEDVKRPGAAKGFEILARRWVVERTFVRLGRCRRLAKNGEHTIFSAEASITISDIRIPCRRLARYCYPSWSLESDSMMAEMRSGIIPTPQP